MVAVPIKITRSAAGYTVQATGPGRKAKAKYSVRCTVGSNGVMTLRVAAKSKRASLKSALGGGINLGFSAAPTLPAAVGLTTTFGVVK